MIQLEDPAIAPSTSSRHFAKPRQPSSHRRNRLGKNKKTAVTISPNDTCAEETKLIGDYLSDHLDTSQRQAFEGHLKACPECAAFLATYKKTIILTRSFLTGFYEPAPKKITLGMLDSDLH